MKGKLDMGTFLEPHDLIIWRRKRKVKQSELAHYLGVSTTTISNWECGRHAIPARIALELERIAINLKPDLALKAPATITKETAPLRPDLELYVRDPYPPHPIVWGRDHPERLGIPRGADGTYPWDMLESAEYLAVRKRAGRTAP